MPNFRLYGDTENSLGDRTLAEDQTLFVSGATYYDLVQFFGDADALRDRAQGGDDLFSGARGGTLEVVGDARLLADRSQGGDDTVGSGFDMAFSFIYGDAKEMTDRARGGDDVLQAALKSGARAASTNEVYGDAETLRDRSEGGDDVLIGRDYPFTTSELYGDGRVLSDRSRGGDDTIISGERSNEEMWGDAACVGSKSHTGADTFVFAPVNGSDVIHDFERGKDLLSFSALAGVDDFESLAPYITERDGGTRIGGAGGLNTVFLVGVFGLSASDVIFS